MSQMINEERQLILDIYKELIESERHFNELESKYRFLASTWLLALFAAIGFFLTKDASTLIVDIELLICGLAFVSVIGITQLWNIDLRVYHQLLDACFVERLEIERANQWLPQMGVKQVLSQYEQHEKPRPDGGVMARIKLFYVGLICTCLTISGLSLTAWAYKGSIYFSILIFLFFIHLAYFWSKLIWKKTKSPLLGNWVRKAKAELGYD